MYPKGKLIAIGGAENKGTPEGRGGFYRHNLNFIELGILRKVVQEAGGNNAHIEVITTASSIPYEIGENYIDAFGKIGCTNIGLLHIRNRSDAQQEDYLQRIKHCDAVMISGGNQLRLATIFGGTLFLKILLERYENEENFLIAGTSAGAMGMSNTMIYEGDPTRAHLKGEIKITTGLGFIDDVIIDSHFEKRGRFGRLVQAVASNPQCIGIGLGEDTGMFITKGNNMEAIGSGLVMIVDGHDIAYSNIADIPDGNPISVENIKVHLCAHGNGYLLSERKFVEQMYPKPVAGGLMH